MGEAVLGSGSSGEGDSPGTESAGVAGLEGYREEGSLGTLGTPRELQRGGAAAAVGRRGSRLMELELASKAVVDHAASGGIESASVRGINEEIVFSLRGFEHDGCRTAERTLLSRIHQILAEESVFADWIFTQVLEEDTDAVLLGLAVRGLLVTDAEMAWELLLP
ncbi:hypothetical protein MLD38_025849 [Melastoma candidum]|uniref:Uncharacterized protein n=1 Tax=Melastoma candidum TaxID=119954 RepID=A0ACB9P067_9MYRT|nr:hypothetical protein MLD38_025849 [Melastoma candidum]